MLKEDQRDVIHCSADTLFKQLTGRHVSVILSDMGEVCGMCVHECWDSCQLACAWTNDPTIVHDTMHCETLFNLCKGDLITNMT